MKTPKPIGYVYQTKTTYLQDSLNLILGIILISIGLFLVVKSVDYYPKGSYVSNLYIIIIIFNILYGVTKLSNSVEYKEVEVKTAVYKK